MAHKHAALVHCDAFVGDDVGQRGTGLDHRSLHEDAVDHLGPRFNDDTTGDDGIFHVPLDVAAIGHQGAGAGGTGAVVGGGVGLVLGADGALGVEEVGPDGGVQQIHGAVVVVIHRLEAAHIALVDIGDELQRVQAGLENAPAEVRDIVGGAVVHHAQQQLLGQNVQLQRFQLVAGGDGVDGQVGDAAGLADLHILGGAGRAPEGGGADHGDIGPGVQVLLEHVGHRQVQCHIPPAEDDIVLTDVV